MPIHFAEAIPDCLSQAANVNIASAWLLSGGGHHNHTPVIVTGMRTEGTIIKITMRSREIVTATGVMRLEVFEDGVPPRFRLRACQTGPGLMGRKR